MFTRTWTSSRWIVLALLAAASATTSAYVLKGFKWSTRQVPFYVNSANLDVAATEAVSALQVGAGTWSQQSNAEFTFYYAGTTTGTTAANNGKNEVFFRNTTNNGAIATTYYWYSGSQLMDADIIFWDGGYTFFTGSSGCSGGFYVEDVAAHEFGHALGLGHSGVGTATMYPSAYYCDPTLRQLDPDDLAGVEYLYPGGGSPAPTAPTNLAASADPGTPTSAIRLSWSDNATDESQFLVERSTDGATWWQIAQLGANTVAYVNSGLPSGSTFTYRVRASNSGGFSGYTNSAAASTTVSTSTPPPSPASPYPTSGATSVSVDADVSWQGTGATRFDLYFGTSSAPQLYGSGLTSPGAALPTLAQGTTYYWRVVAKNASGETSGPLWRFTTKVVRGRKAK